MASASSSDRSYGALEDRAQRRTSLLPDLARVGDEHREPEGAHSSDASRGSQQQRLLKVLAVGCLAVAALAATTLTGSRTSQPVTKAGASPATGFVEVSAGPAVEDATIEGGLAPLAFTAVNFYHERDGKPGQHLPWLDGVKLVEPHRPTTLAVSNSRDGHEYRWEVRAGSNAGELHASARGAEASVVVTRLEENVITLEEVDSRGVVTRRLDEMIMVKYVRREIRTLTDIEREELLDAVSLLCDLSSVWVCSQRAQSRVDLTSAAAAAVYVEVVLLVGEHLFIVRTSMIPYHLLYEYLLYLSVSVVI